MPNLPAARSELDRIEAFLRTRYHYPHPIFEHVATCRGHLEGELPIGVVEAPQEMAPPEPVVEEMEVPPVEGELPTSIITGPFNPTGETITAVTSEEPPPAAPTPTRRKTRRKSK